MAKKSKLSTPAWIMEGFDSPAEYEKAKGVKNKKPKVGKVFNIRKCPECGSDEVGVVITGEEGKGGNWECRKCKWIGRDVEEEEMTEDEFMKYLDEKGEGVS